MNYHFDDGPLTLQDGLESMTTYQLKDLAALTGQKVPSRKPDIVALIVRHLSGEGLRIAWEGLDELQRAAVAECVHSPSPWFQAESFRDKYGGDPQWGSRGSYGSETPTALRFFFYGHQVPADLKARLLQFVPEPAPVAIATLDELPPAYGIPFEQWTGSQHKRGTVDVPLTVHEREQAALKELLSLLRLADAGKMVVSDKTKRPSASTIEAVRATLESGDYYADQPPKRKYYDQNAGPIRAFAWPMLIQAGGLAQLAGTRLQLTKSGRKALSEAPAVTIRALWKKWMTTTLLDELSRIDCVKGQTGKGQRGLTAVSGRRETIAGGLAGCQVGRWIEAAELSRYMRATGKYFDVARDCWALYIGEPQYGSLEQNGGVGILNQRYLFALLLEYAATLGMLDVALIPPEGARKDFQNLWGTDDLPFFSRYDGLIYFRLTPLGAYCLDVQSAYEPPAMEVKAVLRVLPNLEIAATGAALEPSDRLALGAYANPVSDFVWRLETGKLLTAIEAGRQVQEIREFLEARSGEELPGTVSRLLDDVAGRASQIRDLGLARLVECADSALAALIANDSRTRKHCMRAGERHLVVAASSETAFRRGLRDAGYLVKAADKPR